MTLLISRPVNRNEKLRLAVSTYHNADPRRPVAHVAEMFGVTTTTVQNWLREARSLGMLASEPGTAFVGSHQPRMARWSDGDSWMACSECRAPWPCSAATTG